MENYEKNKAALIIQYNYKKKKLNNSIILDELKYLKNYLLNILNNSQNNYEKYLINNKNLNTIYDSLKEINDILQNINIDSKDVFRNKTYIILCENKIKDLLTKSAPNKICMICDIFNVDSELINLYNEIFIPISIKFKYIEEDFKIFTNKSDIIKNNLNYIINGTNLNLKLNDTEYISIQGTFISDNINIYNSYSNIKNKIDLIKKELNFTNAPIIFCNRYIKQLSLKNLITLNINEIVNELNSDFELLKTFDECNISNLVKKFVSSDIYNQRKIMILLLLSENTEINYLANLLFNMISNDSELLSHQPNTNMLYNSLHRNIQILLDNNNKEIENNKRKNLFKTLSIENISYEKRINIMKCDETIKKKAMDRLKEMKGNKDSNYKAQQYIDSLLKIPFGIYKKEELFTFLQKYLSKMKKYMIEIKKIIPLPNFENDDSINAVDKIKILVDKFIIDECKTENYANSFLKNIEITVNEINNKKVESNIVYVKNKFLDLIDEWKKYKEKKINYIKSVRSTLDLSTYSQNEAKSNIERIIAQWINGKMEGAIFGICGPPGVGKTSLIKNGLSKCLLDNNKKSRPFSFIALGGSTNGSTLEGHGYTYVNSQYGRIIETLIESNCMNPIIFIDELDKVSLTEHGREIIGILTHITDPTQNMEFIDKYFSGIKIDLSKVLFIFSYNDPDKIDRILKDRITEIKVNALKKKEKIYICNNYILPEILDSVGYTTNEIQFKEDAIDYIIENYTYEAGVRKLKEKVFEIIRDINLKNIMGDEDIVFPYTITIDFVKKIFNDKPTISIQKIAKKPLIGMVNGLYATTNGTGGLSIIEVMKVPTDKTLSLELTGQQGDVMKESMKCAKSVVWNLLPEELKKNIYEDFNNSYSGLHIHCPDAGTPKDGPSAGIAICTAIVSRLCNIPVINTVAMTGEIDLMEGGKINKIGGLEAKLTGAKRAGVKTVLIPADNKEDYEKIDSSLDLDVHLVNHISEVLEKALEKNNINFVFEK
jgi:ATP-dependent Lon protease